MSNKLIYLKRLSGRWFPHLTKTFYTSLEDETKQDLSPEQQIAYKILRLPDTQFTFWQRVIGSKLDASGKVGRLLLFHKMAMEAELAERWPRADFLWRKSHRLLRKLVKKDEIWKELLACLKKKISSELVISPVKLRHHFVNEIFIDTHCALYNGLILKGEKEKEEEIDGNHRAFTHIDYVKSIVDISDISAGEHSDMLDPVIKMRISIYEKEEEYIEAVKICKDVLKSFPDKTYFQDKLANLYCKKVMAELTNSSNRKISLSDAAQLKRMIEKLKGLHKKYPYNTQIFQLLGQLFYIRSIKLVNGERISEALVEIRRALTYDPYIPEGEKTFQHFEQLMKQLQAQMYEVQRQISHNTRLNDKGQRLINEANKGFSPLRKYIDSNEESKIKEEIHIAYARSLWDEIGLKAPSDHWDERAKILLKIVNYIFTNPPKNVSTILDVWQEVANNFEELSDLNTGLILQYIQKRLFNKSDESSIELSADSPPSVSILTPELSKKIPADEPFSYWFFSWADVRIKFQAAAAVVLILITGVLMTTDFSARKTRDAAYTQIIKAADEQNHQKIITESKKFLSTFSIIQDKRESQVKNLKEKAVGIQIREEAYQKAIKADKDGDYLKVIESGETFFDTPDLTESTVVNQMRDFYSKAFVHWLMAQEGTVNPSHDNIVNYNNFILSSQTTR